MSFSIFIDNDYRNKEWTTKGQTTCEILFTSARGQGWREGGLPPRVIPKKMDVRLIKDFKELVPLVFRGGINFLEAEHWLKEVKKILDVLEVPEERRVSLASFMLRDEADSWWDMVKSTHDVPHMGWTQFEELLLAKYFPEAMRRQKRSEFVHL